MNKRSFNGTIIHNQRSIDYSLNLSGMNRAIIKFQEVSLRLSMMIIWCWRGLGRFPFLPIIVHDLLRVRDKNKVHPSISYDFAKREKQKTVIYTPLMRPIKKQKKQKKSPSKYNLKSGLALTRQRQVKRIKEDDKKHSHIHRNLWTRKQNCHGNFSSVVILAADINWRGRIASM